MFPVNDHRIRNDSSMISQGVRLHLVTGFKKIVGNVLVACLPRLRVYASLELPSAELRMPDHSHGSLTYLTTVYFLASCLQIFFTVCCHNHIMQNADTGANVCMLD
jgi:hypothetical protein